MGKPEKIILEHIDARTCKKLGGKFDKKTGKCKILKRRRKRKDLPDVESEDLTSEVCSALGGEFDKRTGKCTIYKPPQ